MAWRKSPPHLIELFDQVIPADSRIERRKMFGYPAAFLNGRLFAGLHQESFILKLSSAHRARLVNAYQAKVFEPMPNRVMREYMVLPERLLSNHRTLRAWLGKSIAYVGALPPKSVKASKAKKAGTSRLRSSPSRAHS